MKARARASSVPLSAAVLLACLAARPAGAAGLSLEGGARRTVSYDCGTTGPRKVTYVNAAENALAIVDIDGSERIFVNVISGSGARYASGGYVWWTKGPEASLYDVRRGPDAAPVAVCREGGG